MRGRGDDGSVVVEFIALAVLLMVPMVYVLLTLASIQSATLASVVLADDLSRQRAAAVGDDAGLAARQRVTLEEAAKGYGLDPSAIHVEHGCRGRCDRPGAVLDTSVRIDVVLPLMPSRSAKAITVSSASTTLVQRYG